VTEDKWRPNTKSRDMVPELREMPRSWKDDDAIQGKDTEKLGFTDLFGALRRIREALKRR
jgi:hypothetical protein